MIHSVLAYAHINFITILYTSTIPVTAWTLINLASRGSIYDKVQQLSIPLLIYTVLLLDINMCQVGMVYALIEVGTILFLLTVLTGTINTYCSKTVKTFNPWTVLAVATSTALTYTFSRASTHVANFSDVYIKDTTTNEFVQWFTSMTLTNVTALTYTLVLIVCLTVLIVLLQKKTKNSLTLRAKSTDIFRFINGIYLALHKGSSRAFNNK